MQPSRLFVLLQGAANFVAQMLGSVAGAVLLLLATRVRLLCAAYRPCAAALRDGLMRAATALRRRR